MMSTDIIQKISRWLPDVKTLHGYVLKLSTKSSQCERAKMQARIYWIRQVCGPSLQEISIEIVRQGVQDEEARQDSKSLTCFSVVLCNATLWSCKSVGLNHDVCWLVEHRDTIEVEGLRHQQSAFPSNSPETRKCPSSSGRSTETWCRRSWQIDQEHPWNSRHITSGNLTT